MITLSEEQMRIANEAIDNILVKKQRSFISGPAGCGKTSIANKIAEILSERGMSVYFAAPTHTASNRLQKVLEQEGAGKITVSTVHKFLRMRVQSRKFGKAIFGPPADLDDILEDNGILIVDESSMVNDENLGYIIRACRHKVIFLGDSCQIPPVTLDDDSKTRLLTINDSEPAVARTVKNRFELKKVYRQNTNTQLYKLCNTLRKSILDGSCVKLFDNKKKLFSILYEHCDIDDTVYADINGSEVIKSLIDIEDTCFIAFGNPTVQAVQEQLPEWYVDGGKCITNSPVFNIMKVDNKTKWNMLLPNNSHIKINNIQKSNFLMWGVKFDTVIIEPDYKVFVPADPTTYNDEFLKWIEVVKYNSKSGTLSFDQITNYEKYDYKTLTNDNFNEFIAKVVTFREGRASTTHRAQGQQWDNCIIAVNNILFSGVNMSKEKVYNDTHRKIIAMKMLYTAISRAKEKVVFCFEHKKESYTK